MDPTLILSRDDVRAMLPLPACIAVVQDAFLQLGRGEVAPPATLGMRSGGGGFHIKAAVLRRGGRSYFAAKTNANFPENPRTSGLPTIQGVVLLFDAACGSVLAVMDSTEITALRTAAATAVAVRLLARSDASELAIFGCGVQGRMHWRALREVLAFEHVHLYDTEDAAARTLAVEVAADGVDATVHADAGTAAARAAVCVTCTSGGGYVLDAGMVQPGTLVAGVGTDNDHKRELTPALLAGAKVVTDLRAQCALIGDLHHALAANVMTEAAVHADLGDVVAGRRPGRESPGETIVFDSTGLAIQDVAAAAAVYEQALAAARSPARVATPCAVTLA